MADGLVFPLQDVLTKATELEAEEHLLVKPDLLCCPGDVCLAILAVEEGRLDLPVLYLDPLPRREGRAAVLEVPLLEELPQALEPVAEPPQAGHPGRALREQEEPAHSVQVQVLPEVLVAPSVVQEPVQPVVQELLQAEQVALGAQSLGVPEAEQLPQRGPVQVPEVPFLPSVPGRCLL